MRRFIRPLRERRTYRETRSLLTDLPLGVFWFTVTVTGLSLGLGLAVTVVGVPVLTATLLVCRAGARRERARAREDTHLDEPPTVELVSGNWRDRMRLLASDRDTKRAVAYLCLLLPFGVAVFSVVVTFWVLSLALITLPTWNWALPGGGALLFGARNSPTGGFRIHTAPELAAAVALGVVVLVLTPWVVRGRAKWKVSIVRALLTPTPSSYVRP